MAVVVESYTVADIAALSTVLTIAKPSGTVAGDRLLFVVSTFSAAASGVTSTGFTVNKAAGGNVWFGAKDAGGSEPADYTITRSGSSSSVMSAVLFRISGHDTSALMDVYNATAAATGTTHEIPSVTAAAAGLLLSALFKSGDIAPTSTAPSGMTLGADNSTLTRCAIGWAHQSIAAGATGTKTWTSSSGNNGNAGHVVIAAQAAINLTVADTAHGHTTDAVALTQVHQLAGVADSAHQHGTDSVALTQVHQLAGVADTAHGHTTDTAALTQLHQLAGFADSAHQHGTDSVALTQVHQLAGVADTAHGHTVENVTLSTAGSLAVDDTAHSHTTDAVALTQLHQLTAADTSHQHTADAVTLAQVHQLAVTDSSHGHTTEAVTLVQAYQLVVAGSRHAHVTELVQLAQVHALTVLDSLHEHRSDNITLPRDHVDTPPRRTARVPAELRIAVVGADTRTAPVPAENRTAT